MKTTFMLFISLLIGFVSVSQNGINYKAVIKDANGNVVANDQIQIRLTILQGATAVYTETHAPTTDANGMVIINIGEGTPVSGNFGTVEWGSGLHSLNVQINIGGGLVNMGTTEFKTVPYALQAANVTGLEAIDEGNGIGWRLVGSNPEDYGSIGLNAVDLSHSGNNGIPSGASGDYSTAMGPLTRASGTNSTAMGIGSIASGYNSTAMGVSTEAFGAQSTAMGNNTTALGFNSTSIGFNTTALGNVSTAMGLGTKADAYVSHAIGRYNVAGGNPTSWIETDKLFEIGNGTSTSLSNALTILKNGNVGISIASPQVKLQITDGTDASLSGGSGYMVIGNQGSTNLVFDTNEIMARNLGGTSPLYLQNEGGNVYVGGALVHSSDRRLKEHITDLPYGLKEILQLQPKSYHWKNREQSSKSLGLIAQDVKPIISEIVLTKEDKNHTLSINYTELIPVLIKAIQEQQIVIENLRTEVRNLNALEQRMILLETMPKLVEQNDLMPMKK